MANQATPINQTLNPPESDDFWLYLPIGTVTWFAGDVLPPGWMPADGRKFNRLRHLKLWRQLRRAGFKGNRLPDFRGSIQHPGSFITSAVPNYEQAKIIGIVKVK